ncbi:MAG: type II secretion system protein GspL [Cellvibrionaceae bacterium]|nr:type II secretion system protein GspL [Cellvibrionaceae bacterium]
MSERILVRKIGHNLWQWREASAEGEWLSEAFYTGDVNLLKESVEGRQVWLIVPGQEVVSQRVEVEIKDRKQLLKILPYEIEDGIIDAVEDLHFVYGNVENDTIAVAYTDADWLQACIGEVEAAGAEVQRCSVDYLQLPRPAEGWVLLLENEALIAQVEAGSGFAVEQSMAGAFLAALAAQYPPPAALHLYGDSEASLMALHALLPATITQNEAIAIAEQEAGFWDLVSPASPLAPEFRSGKLARRLPFEKWWQEFKYPIIATAAGFLIAVATTAIGLSKVEAERKRIMAQTDAIFRQAVPQGTISDPARQLRGMLGGGANQGQSSNVVSLLAGIAPAIKSLNEVSVRSFRYSHDTGHLQLNLEAKSFDTFETLRSRIAEKGLSVEIKSANVYGDVHQAQLRVSEAG